MGHATFSPSAAHRWLPCPGSVALESRCPDESSEFADEGTAAHELAARVLQTGADPHQAVGGSILVNGAEIKITDEMAAAIARYAEFVRALGGTLMIEQRLPLVELTGEAVAEGTADAIVVLPDELIVVDLKYGRGVRVDAPGNEQLQIYGLAALLEYEYLGDFKRVRTVIVQPRLEHMSEEVTDVDVLRAFAPVVASGASRGRAALAYFRTYEAVHERYLNPGDAQCRFCRAKATCPALAKYVLCTVSDDFVDVTQLVAPQLEGVALRTFDNVILGNLLGAVDLVEIWCKAVRAQAEVELFAGHAVPGYKLVEGRRGSRQWADPAEAELALKAMRLRTEEMYDLKLISPTSAEKLAKKMGDDGKPIIGPRQWPKLQELITQPDGKPSVAPETDKRPALVVKATAEEFDDEEASLV